MSESSWVEQGKKAKRNRLIAFAFVLACAVIALVIYNNREMLSKPKNTSPAVSSHLGSLQKVVLPPREADTVTHKAKTTIIEPVAVGIPAEHAAPDKAKSNASVALPSSLPLKSEVAQAQKVKPAATVPVMLQKEVIAPVVLSAKTPVAEVAERAPGCTLSIAGIMSPVLGQNDLQVRISLACICANAAACKVLAHQPERVRALCVRTLASTTLDNMTADKLREKLARDLRGLGGEVTDIFFTEFMIDRIVKQ